MSRRPPISMDVSSRPPISMAVSSNPPISVAVSSRLHISVTVSSRPPISGGHHNISEKNLSNPPIAVAGKFPFLTVK